MDQMIQFEQEIVLQREKDIQFLKNFRRNLKRKNQETQKQLASTHRSLDFLESKLSLLAKDSQKYIQRKVEQERMSRELLQQIKQNQSEIQTVKQNNMRNQKLIQISQSQIESCNSDIEDLQQKYELLQQQKKQLKIVFNQKMLSIISQQEEQQRILGQIEQDSISPRKQYQYRKSLSMVQNFRVIESDFEEDEKNFELNSISTQTSEISPFITCSYDQIKIPKLSNKK